MFFSSGVSGLGSKGHILTRGNPYFERNHECTRMNANIGEPQIDIPGTERERAFYPQMDAEDRRLVMARFG